MFFIRSKTVFAGLVAFAVRSSGLLQRPSLLLKMSTVSQSQGLNVDQYLSITNYRTHGNEFRLQDQTQVYATGSPQSKNAVIIIPDTLGWNTGRVRNFCDLFGDNNLLAVIPNFGSKGIEGQTQSFMESSGVMDWYKSRTFDGNIKPTIVSVVKFLKSQGVEKISLLGFAWGTWAAVNLLASDVADEFYCAALSSPSIDLEEKFYGGSLPELMSRVNRPLLLMPTRGDSEHYKAFLKLLKYKLPTSQVIDYHDVEANFMLRGNSDNEAIKHVIQKSVHEIFGFFQDHFQREIKDFVREGEDLGPEAAKKEGSSWGEQMQGYGEQMKESLEQSRERVGKGLQEAGSRIGQQTQQTGEKIGEQTQQTGEKIGEQTQQAGERIGEQTQQAGERIGEQTKQTGDKVGEGTRQSGEQIKQSSQTTQRSPSSSQKTDNL